MQIGRFYPFACLGVLAASLFLTHAAARPQEPAEPKPPIVKVEARQVVVPVVVIDRKGHHVTGLKASDFRVFEEGVEQQVVGFGTELAADASGTRRPGNVELNSSEETSPSAIGGPNPAQRTYVVAVDTLFLTFDSGVRVRRAISKLFAQERATNSNYALVCVGRRVRVVRGLTARPGDVLAASQSEDLPSAMGESGGGNLAGQVRELRSFLESYCRECRCITSSLAMGRPDFRTGLDKCTSMLAQIEAWAASAALERAVATKTFFRQLQGVFQQLSQQPGKRVVVLLSDGFDLWPGRDLFTMISVYVNRPDIATRNPAERLGHELNDLERAATSGDVVVYTVDARGLPAPTFGVFDAEHQGGRFSGFGAGPAVSDMVSQMSMMENARQDTMARLADVTGGVFFKGNNDLAKGMRQAFADEREYYVLAYSPTNREADGSFRKIRVELKNKKLKLRAKQGYWAPAPPHTP